VKKPTFGICSPLPEDTHIAPLEEQCHSLKNTTFQESGKTTDRGDAIATKEKRHFSPLAAILENRRVTLFH
jgi:hypothetical protein